jgi:hypothetical protein
VPGCVKWRHAPGRDVGDAGAASGGEVMALTGR